MDNNSSKVETRIEHNDGDSDDVIEITSSNDRNERPANLESNRRKFSRRRDRFENNNFKNFNNRPRAVLKNVDGQQKNDEFYPNRNLDKFEEKLAQALGPTYDLPPLDASERKFNGRNRLYIGNIGNDFSEQDIISLFEPYGEPSEVFINKEKNFGFVKMDFHCNAEKAKRELDGTIVKSRNLKIRFAPNTATVKVKNLSPFVTNELLHYSFAFFGDIEKAKVLVDERGRPTGEGIVDFARKGSATHAIQRCSHSCFFITNSLRPVIVEPYDLIDDNDGYSDKNINKKSLEFRKEREIGPRIAHASSFEHEYGLRWKSLFELQKHKEEGLKKEFKLEKEKLEAQMEYIRYEHETEVLREQLRAREMDKERQKREWESKRRQAEEEKVRYDEAIRRQQVQIELRMTQQQDDARRRHDESSLLMQAQTLSSLLDHQEEAYADPTADFNASGSAQQGHGAFQSSYEGNAAGENLFDRRGHWVKDNNNRTGEFQNKRRRF